MEFLLKNKYPVILAILIGFFVIYFSYLSILRYRTLNSHYYDLGIMNQVVYNTAKGRILEMTNQDLKKNINRLAVHFDPILIVFAPFYWFFPYPDVLLVAQAAILGLGAWVIYLIAKKKLKNQLISFLFAVVYLSYFPIQRVLLFDFHAVVFATTFFLFALYFQEEKNWFWYFVFVFLSLFTKEHVGLTVFLLGFYLYFIKREKIIGLVTSIVGILFFITTVYVIIPYFRGEPHFATGYFFGIMARKETILKEGFVYIGRLILPTFYALFSPLTLIISSPEWVINIVSLNNNMRAIFFHYNSIIVPFLFYSLIEGYKNFNRLITNKKVQSLFLAVFFILNLRSIYLYNPTPSFVKQPVKYEKLDKITESSIKIWQGRLADEKIKVSTTPRLAPFFTNRQYYHNFLFDLAYPLMGLTDDDIMKKINDYKAFDYVIIYRPEIGDISKGTLSVKFYQKLREDDNFAMIFSNNLQDKEIEVYKKIKD